jgi:hypothetical protein
VRVYAPEVLRTALMHEFHNVPIAGHLGWRKCYLAVSQHYYWPGMSESVRIYVTSCPVCQRKKKTLQPRPPMRPLPVLARRFESITLDWIELVMIGLVDSTEISMAELPLAYC